MIITQGKNPIISVTLQIEKVMVEEHPVKVIEKSKIVDTNGAGDSFVGGFLSQIYLGKDLHTAIKAGIALSAAVV